MEPAKVLSVKSVSLFDIDEDEKTPFYETIFYRIKYRIKNFCSGIKYSFQKLIRPYHAFDLELWNLDGLMAKMLYPKIVDYKKMERHGYIEKRAVEGFRLLGEYFTNFWD